MGSKDKNERSGGSHCLLCTLLVCSMLLAASGITFAMYTVRELGQLRAILNHQEQLIIAIQRGDTVVYGKSVIKNLSSWKRVTRSLKTDTKGENQSANKRVTASIHLVGDGTMITPFDVLQVNKWRVMNKQGNIGYQQRKGGVEIVQPGYYFVYSQMYCYDGTPLALGHSTYVNRREVMKSVSAAAEPNRNQKTGYHGGVFKLKTRDRVYISIPHNNRFLMNPAASYFGLFLLQSA